MDDFLLYMQNEIQNLRHLKENLIKEVYAEMCRLENSLATYVDKIDEEIAKFSSKINEAMEALENNEESINSDYSMLSTNDLEFIRASQITLNSKTPYKTIISEVYRNIGWVKLSEFQEIFKEKLILEVKLLDINTIMSQYTPKNIKENEELKQSYEALKTREIELIKNIEITEQKYIKENEELKQSYEALKAKEIELIKNIEVTEQSNKYLKDAYDELYKKYQDLESRNSKPDDAQLQRAAPIPFLAQRASTSSLFFGRTVSNSFRRRQ
ncbi:unnamed protein product [Blepharisma stoltei]|uniref:Uncharacterized protein n=1 Tax=Blepharisma stoltei TaxID=1481888 RepID=A0AAU9KBR9_9CILI|nr:unnamed protein product [Blepharisma stoltei]